MKHFVVRNEQNLKISKKEAINKTKLKDDNINNELKDTILINSLQKIVILLNAT